MAHSYILLKDKGEVYPRGELVESVELENDGRYSIHSHSEYTQVVDPIAASSDEVAPLAEEECRILDAIPSPADRYTVYSTPGKLAWGVGLKVGDTVLAKLPPQKGGRGSSGGGEQQELYTTAILRWCGDIEDSQMYLFGLEIADEKHYGHGNSDGTYNKGGPWEKRYFSCKQDCGLFYTLAKIRQRPAHCNILLNDTHDGYYRRGELVELESFGGYTHHYHYQGKCVNPNQPSADPAEAVPLTEEECNILYGIDSAADRYTVYSTPGKLAWGVGLKVGDTVLARLPPKGGRGSFRGEQQSVYTAAIIRWHGEVTHDWCDPIVDRSASSHLFGVEIIDERHYGHGDSDGTYYMPEQRCFSCPASCGLFLTLADLKPPPSPHGAMAADLQEGVSLKDKTEEAEEVSSLTVEIARQQGRLQGEMQENEATIAILQKEVTRLLREVKGMSRLQGEVQKKEITITGLQRKVAELQGEAREKARLQGEVKEKETSIARLQEEVREKKTAIARLQGEVKETKTTIARLQGRLHGKLEGEMKEKEATIVRLQGEAKEKARLQGEVRKKEATIARLEREAKGEAKEKARLQGEVREKEATIAQLQGEAREKARLQGEVSEKEATIAGQEGEEARLQATPQQALQLWELPREEVHISQTILGTGGWGYVARGTFQGQPVAVKCLHRGILSPQNEGRVRREISIMAQIRHPNLLLLIGAVLTVEGAGPLIVMELLDRSLRSAYEDGLLEERSKLPVLRDVASALTYLHSHHTPIIHRDVSSANVLLEATRNDSQWKGKLSDFGSANLSHLATTPAEGAVVYAAPEVNTEDRNRQTPKIDVYSFGVLVCEVCLCRFPPERRNFPSMLGEVRGTAPNVFLLARDCTSHAHQDRPPMRDILQRIDQLRSVRKRKH